MMKLDNFVGMMTGHFDNKDQFNKMQAEGKTYPYAEHVNTICNDKINICERLLSYIEKSAGEEELLYDRMLFRIMIEKKSEDIAEMEALLEKKEAEKIKKDQKQDQQVQMGILQYLLGLQYSYQKNRRQMELYLNKARVNLKGTPYHKKVKQLLNKA